ncbi:hypothetical protein F4810DRAFT_570681 [Camillea tinctor]|nr:hypothetical protein F4810DRAFT_570681 [Camillea tinctor]
MASLKSILSTFLMANGTSSPAKHLPLARGCGEVNVLYTGLPGTHNLVAAQGWDVEQVDRKIRKGHQDMINAGYNVRTVLFGPEQNIDDLAREMDGINWGITGVGFGVRGSTLEELIVEFEDILMTFRQKALDSPTVFNYNPDSFLWSIQRRAPLSSDCAGSPGKNLGYVEICQDECQNGEAKL